MIRRLDVQLTSVDHRGLGAAFAGLVGRAWPNRAGRAAAAGLGHHLPSSPPSADLVTVKHRNTNRTPEMTEAVFQYGSDGYELPVAEVKRLMLDVETIMNGRGTGLVRATIDGSEKAFLISAGALVTFHVPIGTLDEDPDE